MTDRHNDLRAWIRLDAGYAFDPRIVRVTATAELLFVRHLATARKLGTDGHLTTEQLPLVQRGIERRTAQRGWEALVREGLLEPCEDGFRVPFERWSRWQTTEAEMDDARERARQRKAQWRARQREDGT